MTSRLTSAFVGHHLTIGSLRFAVVRYDRSRRTFTLRNVTTVPFDPSNDCTLHADALADGLQDRSIRVLLSAR